MFSKLVQRRTLGALCNLRASISSAGPAATEKPVEEALSSEYVYDREAKYGAHNYHPLPVALERGKGLSSFSNIHSLAHCSN